METSCTHREELDSEYRQFGRAHADVYVNKIIGDEPHLARVRDISVGGLFLYRLLEPEMQERGRVGLEIKLPNSDDVIWAVGEVVRMANSDDTNGVGIRFVRMTETDREMIKKYVESQE